MALSRQIPNVVQVQSWNWAQTAYALYVEICESNRGVVGGVPSHFGKEGRCGLYWSDSNVCRAYGGVGRECICAITASFCWQYWYMSEISSVVGSTV